MGQTFEELIGRQLDDLYSAALCFTLDEHRAEELLQEASIRAFHESARRPPDWDFRLAMLNILVSTYLQRQRRMGCDPLAEGTEPLDKILSTNPMRIEPFPEPGAAGYRLLRDWMDRVWSELDAGDRLVLWLADVERIRHAVVAGMVGLDVEAIRSRHYRARLALSRGVGRQLDRAVGGADAG
jgi:DNA-directed RNA polymerase specialized sigma24 family protein